MIRNSLYPDLNTATRFIDENLYQNFIRKYNEEDDILLTLVGNGIGNITLFPKDKAVIIQNTLGFRAKEDKKFLFFLLMANNEALVKLDRGMAQPSIRQDEILDLDIYVPSNSEQIQIGEYFTYLDNLITLHQRKCEETKKLKKYMLQKMFPQNGKRVPEIRFVGFTEDWEQRKVKEFAIESEVKGHSGKDAKKLTVKLHNKGVYVADEKIQGSDNTQYYIRRAGQFIYGKQNFFNGAIGIVPKKLDKYESTKDVPAFDVSSDVNVDWLYYYIARPEIYKPQEALCTGTGSKRFHVNNFYNLSLAIPKMDEQIKIKEYFVHLDNLITLHQRKYEELQKIKKFMLQNMFI